MLKEVTLENFKCFQARTVFPLSKITIMYGKNGRGKSTLNQSLLLLGQTLSSDRNGIENLQLTGKYVALGSFSDVVNRQSGSDTFGISLKNDTENVEMKFESFHGKPQLARACELYVNNKSRFEVFDQTSGENGDPGEDSAAKPVKSDDSSFNKPAKVETRHLGATSDIKIFQQLKQIRFVSAGRLGPQNDEPRRDNIDDDNLGINGENVINVLARKGKDFTQKVVSELGTVMGGAAIKVSDDDPDRIELFMNSKNGEDTYKPVNVGFGYSYVLPVIVAAYLSEGMLIIENPEAHLHPAAQSRIMEFLIKTANVRNLQLVIETHSDHIVNGLRIAIKNGVLKENDANILFFSDDENPVEVIRCDKNGLLSTTPDDFLDEWTLQLLKIL